MPIRTPQKSWELRNPTIKKPGNIAMANMPSRMMKKPLI